MIIYILLISVTRAEALTKLDRRDDGLLSFFSSLSVTSSSTSFANAAYRSATRSAARPEFLRKQKNIHRIFSYHFNYLNNYNWSIGVKCFTNTFNR